ncbi:MAG TPA: hypothetical protein VF054_14875 [Micromonosporaceae bacterium]
MIRLDVRRRRSILVAVLAVAVLAIAGYGAALLATGRPDVPVTGLLASSPTSGADDEQWRPPADTDPDLQNGTNDTVERVWRRDGGPSVREAVFRYGNPLAARESYIFSAPRFNDHYDEAIPAKDAYRSPAADRGAVVCGRGSPDRCDIWEYRAQYGQYLLRVTYYGYGDPIDTAHFVRYVATIDGYVASRLGR